MKVTFKWSGIIFTGNVTSQTKSGPLGLTTVVDTSIPLQQSFTFYGEFKKGKCGPFTVLSITD